MQLITGFSRILSRRSPRAAKPVASGRSAFAVAVVALMALSLSACSALRFPGVYRIDIAQGNIITQKMVDQLRPGLTKRQVSFILGTPLIRDTFNQSRWDYITSYQPGGGERTQERLTVYFESDKLVRFEGDFQQTPENLQFPANPAPAASAPKQR